MNELRFSYNKLHEFETSCQYWIHSALQLTVYIPWTIDVQFFLLIMQVEDLQTTHMLKEPMMRTATALLVEDQAVVTYDVLLQI